MIVGDAWYQVRYRFGFWYCSLSPITWISPKMIGRGVPWFTCWLIYLSQVNCSCVSAHIVVVNCYCYGVSVFIGVDVNYFTNYSVILLNLNLVLDVIYFIYLYLYFYSSYFDHQPY